jgi:undecaprenyl diphosphate synthase
MDGNGRWAKRRGLTRIAGHQKGTESVRDIVRASRELGIKWLTLYAFSKENWKRPSYEVKALMPVSGKQKNFPRRFKGRCGKQWKELSRIER